MKACYRIAALSFAAALCLLAGRARAEFVILGAGNEFWSDDLEAPVCKQLVKLQKQHSFHSLAFTSRGEWVALLEGNGFYTSQLSLPACEKLAELQPDKGMTFKSVAFTPAGGWTVLWNKNGNWTKGAVPEAAFNKLVEVSKAGGALRSVCYGPSGQWVVLFDKSGVAFGGVPDDLAKALREAERASIAVRCVAFTTTGAWICLTDKGFSTNRPEHPACKMIAELEKQGRPLHWVAVAPEIGPHDFKKWAAYLHEKCDGKVTAGYAFVVLHRGKVVGQGAEGWARTPWQPEHPSVKWTLDKPMPIASVSKTVTAVALLKLWEESGQRFSLDDPFWDRIKAVCPKAHDDVKRVTIRQLLSQKTGFKAMTSYETPADIDKLLVEPLEHKPGTHYHYDNNNFYLARLVIEQIGRVRYTPYVKEHVLRPMGISRMETHYEAGEPTCGYGKPGTKRAGYPFDWKCEETAGAAGWYASANDLGRFLTGLRDHKVLSARTTEMMYDGLLGWDRSQPGVEKNGGWWWDEGDKPGSRAGAVRSSITHFPDDVDAVMLINCDTPDLPEDLLADAWRASMQQ